MANSSYAGRRVEEVLIPPPAIQKTFLLLLNISMLKFDIKRNPID